MSLQSGKGDFPVYRGVSRQYGNGLGSIFKAALRTVFPILKPVAKASYRFLIFAPLLTFKKYEKSSLRSRGSSFERHCGW